MKNRRKIVNIVLISAFIILLILDVISIKLSLPFSNKVHILFAFVCVIIGGYCFFITKS